ncbi:SDR family NAD(P)-dependent oxidoreductase [Frankia sp. CiP3]|uniref:SDR family NAD(P)-dependent oxidoreductase n=1 Tax=Frankia sp. CiP3 TaxID=2880971 RepID=UPI001EF5A075|nr:SDR family NAD(P)-dependent oxidoreductase [Frankia sp. CiP3]
MARVDGQLAGLLVGKVAIVTGAGQGVGRGIAHALAKEGAAVAVGGRTLTKVERTAAEIIEAGGRALAAGCDVADQGQVEALVAAAVEVYGTVDILVNNAQTVVPPKPLGETTPEDLAVCYSSGTLGTFHAMRACFPHLSAHGGRIINLASSTGVEGDPGFASYVMAKEAIRGLTKVAAREWGQYGITVNVICPFGDSPAATAFRDAAPKRFEAVLRKVPLGRMGDCEHDIGGAVVALAGPGMSYVTGATLMVDGGRCVLR